MNLTDRIMEQASIHNGRSTISLTQSTCGESEKLWKLFVTPCRSRSLSLPLFGHISLTSSSEVVDVFAVLSPSTSEGEFGSPKPKKKTIGHFTVADFVQDQ